MEPLLQSTTNLTLFFTLIPLFFLFIKLVRQRGKKTTHQNLPPGPPKLPLIGNMTHIAGPHPHYVMRDLANKFGPLMHLQLGNVSMIVVSSPEFAEDIMKTHDITFASRPVTLAVCIGSYGCTNVAFAPYGPYWRQIRKICVLELLSAKRVQSYRFLRQTEMFSSVQSLISGSPTAAPVNLTDMIFSLTNNVVFRATMGMKSDDTKGLRELMLRMLKDGGGFNVGDFFPSLQFVNVITGFKQQLEEDHMKLDRMLDEIIKQHREKKKEKRHDEEEHEDFIDVLLRLQKSDTLEIPLTDDNIKSIRLQKSDTLEIPLTDDNIKSIVTDMFFGGTDTTASTIEWAMVELMRNPGCMEKAQKEIRGILQGKAKVEEMSDIHGLNYLNLVIKETLRLHPPAPLLVPRESKERCTIGGYDIPAKTRVLVNAYAISRDPKLWENADEFQPERFSDSSIDFKGQNFKYLPFGSGRRGCPGIMFGISMVELTLTNLLYYFDWKLPHGIKPMDLDMTEIFGATVSRKANLNLIPIPVIPLKNETSM